MCYKQNKRGKSDCIDGMLSGNLKYGTLKLNICISLLFTAMLIHGIAPGGLLFQHWDRFLRMKKIIKKKKKFVWS